MPRHLIQHRRRWYAFLEVPDKLRKHFGKSNFKKSLGTDSLSEAEIRKHSVIAKWKREIAEARTREPQRVREEVTWLEWREGYRKSSGEERETLDFVLSEMAEDIRYRDPIKADNLVRVVTGNSAPFDNHLDEWIGTLTDVPKTKDMKRAAVKEFAEDFPFAHQVIRPSIRKWANGLLNNSDVSKRQARKTVSKKLSFVKRYFEYLQGAGYVEGDEEPFRAIIETAKKDKTKAGTKRGWVPMSDQEVVAALDRSIEKGDHSLAALIWLAMWTGCRIEELCSLRASMVTDDRIIVDDAKTKAGNREVPIHSSLTDSIKRLKDTSHDGYIISGLTENKYGDRSNAVGKRFGRLVTELKMGDRKVFHSIRKTVITQLENAGLPHGFVADIAGHEKPNFTFENYSAGVVFEKKKEAIEHLCYPLQRNYWFEQGKRSMPRRRSSAAA